MKITVRELMTKIGDIQRVIDELDKMPDREACTNALQYLDEYIDFVLTRGTMCMFCQLHDYQCPHGWSIDDKIKAEKKLMEENSNA